MKLLFLLAACSDPVMLIAAPDAGGTDAHVDVDASTPPPPTGTHCEVDPSFTDLGSPLAGDRVFHPFAQAVAIDEGTFAVASFGEVLVSDGGEWRALPSDGLPASRIVSIVRFEDTWWVALEFGDPTIFRYDEAGARWEPRGSPMAGTFVADLLTLGGRLAAFTTDGLFVLDAEWREIDFGGAFVTDAAASGRAMYAVIAPESIAGTVIMRSEDLETWLEIPREDSTIEALDLAAAGDTVVVTPGLGAGGGYYRLDEGGALAFTAVVADPVPAWIGEDGTVMARRGAGFAFAASLGAAWVDAPSLSLFGDSTGIAFVWRIASRGSTIALASAIPGGVRVLASRDHGRTFTPIGPLAPVPILEAATDGTTYLLRVRADGGDDRVFVRGESDWIDRTDRLVDRGIAGITGIDGAFLTRPTEYSDTAPTISVDGALAWSVLSRGYPGYDTNAGPSLRAATGFARDADDRFYVATIGGTTSLCCDGTKTPWGYRPGSGIWRYADGWLPVNAGIPIEYGPPPTGGPPFRSDVLSVAATPDGMLASLVGRGVYRLAGDRWSPLGVGLPLDADVRVESIGETALAWSSLGISVLDGDVWLETDPIGSVTALDSRADLLVVASDRGLFGSNDLGETFEPIEGVEPVLVTIAGERLFVTDRANHVHVAALVCEER